MFDDDDVGLPVAKSNKLPARRAAVAVVANALLSSKTSSIPSANVSSLGPVIVTFGSYICCAVEVDNDGSSNSVGKCLRRSVSVQWICSNRVKALLGSNPPMVDVPVVVSLSLSISMVYVAVSVSCCKGISLVLPLLVNDLSSLFIRVVFVIFVALALAVARPTYRGEAEGRQPPKE